MKLDSRVFDTASKSHPAWNKAKLFKSFSAEHECRTINADLKSLQIEHDDVKIRVTRGQTTDSQTQKRLR